MILNWCKRVTQALGQVIDPNLTYDGLKDLARKNENRLAELRRMREGGGSLSAVPATSSFVIDFVA